MDIFGINVSFGKEFRSIFYREDDTDCFFGLTMGAVEHNHFKLAAGGVDTDVSFVVIVWLEEMLLKTDIEWVIWQEMLMIWRIFLLATIKILLQTVVVDMRDTMILQSLEDGLFSLHLMCSVLFWIYPSENSG